MAVTERSPSHALRATWRWGFVKPLTSIQRAQLLPYGRVNNDLALALAMADVADDLTMPAFRSRSFGVERKADGSPVTEIDLAVDDALRAVISRERPDDSVLSEERGADAVLERCWIIDPIDGTRTFLRGIPMFATLIAFQHNGVVEVGVVSAPALGRRWWAVRGEGAFSNGTRVRVSATASIDDALLSVYNSPRHYTISMRERLTRLSDRGSFALNWYPEAYVASGELDAAIIAGSIWDLAATSVIVCEAGGTFSDFGGNDRIDSGYGVVSNGLLHPEILGALTATLEPDHVMR